MATTNNPMTRCPHCQSEVQPGWKACPACGERLPEVLGCTSCGAELQPGWKACPACGNRVESDQGASLNITDEQSAVPTAIREKVEEAGQEFGDDVDDPMMYLELGRTASKSGQHEKAIDSYDDAIRLDPQDAKAYKYRGSTYHDLGQYERAIQDFDEAIRLEPQHAYFYRDRGFAYHELGQLERAKEDYDEAVRLDPQIAKTEEAVALKAELEKRSVKGLQMLEPQWSKPPSNNLLQIAQCTAADVIVWIKGSNVSWADHYLVLTKDELLWIEEGFLGSKSQRHAAQHSAIRAIDREKGFMEDNVLIHSGGALPDLPTKKFEYYRMTQRKNMDILLTTLGFHEDQLKLGKS